MGFKGLVMSDDLEMQAVTQTVEEIPALAVNAGVDLFLICHDISKVSKLQEKFNLKESKEGTFPIKQWMIHIKE